jgi:hypothetical protein
MSGHICEALSLCNPQHNNFRLQSTGPDVGSETAPFLSGQSIFDSVRQLFSGCLRGSFHSTHPSQQQPSEIGIVFLLLLHRKLLLHKGWLLLYTLKMASSDNATDNCITIVELGHNSSPLAEQAVDRSMNMTQYVPSCCCGAQKMQQSPHTVLSSLSHAVLPCINVQLPRCAGTRHC